MEAMVFVYKFGGSCFANKKDFAKVLEVVCSTKLPLIVVLSARSGITKSLKQSFRIAEKSEISNLCVYLRHQHKILYNFIGPKFEKLLTKLEKLLLGAVYLTKVSSELHATILSYGEKLMSTLFYEVLHSLKKPTILIDAEKIFLIKETQYGSFIDHNQSTELIEKEVSPFLKSRIILVPGYYGSSLKGKTTLLGDSGTDYSATSLGATLNADTIVLWKNVDGFMTGDPTIIKHPKTIPKLSYNSAEELAYFGAKLLHSKAIYPALRKKCKIQIQNLYNEVNRTFIFEKEKKFFSIVHIERLEEMRGNSQNKMFKHAFSSGKSYVPIFLLYKLPSSLVYYFIQTRNLENFSKRSVALITIISDLSSKFILKQLKRIPGLIQSTIRENNVSIILPSVKLDLILNFLHSALMQEQNIKKLNLNQNYE